MRLNFCVGVPSLFGENTGGQDSSRPFHSSTTFWSNRIKILAAWALVVASRLQGAVVMALDEELPLAQAMAGGPVLYGIAVGGRRRGRPGRLGHVVLVRCVVVQHLGELLPGDEDAGMKKCLSKYSSTPIQ